jgi:putative transposase
MLIMEEKNNYPVYLLCKVLGISRVGYYQWQRHKATMRKIENLRLLEKIRYYYESSRRTYGLPRLWHSLRREGIIVNRKRVYRLMKLNNIRSKMRNRFRVTTRRDERAVYSKNLINRNFRVGQKKQIWTSDITYLWTKEGWFYLAVVMDMFSRRIIGWSTGINLSANLVERAIRMALHHRRPDGGVIFHSDRGGQYTSSLVRETLRKSGAVQFMSSTGNCYDNAVTESFFHTLKTEWTNWESYQTREEAKSSIFEFIEIFYNRKRLHSTLNYLSPVEFEDKNMEITTNKVA